MEVQITDKALEQIMNLPAIDKKAITKWDKNQEKVRKIYNKVEWSEIFNLDYSIIQWLKPRLLKLIEKWENYLDLEFKPQKKTYNEFKEMVSLSDYILEEKWWNDVPEPVNTICLEEMFVKAVDSEGKEYTTIREATPEEKEYYDKTTELELKAKDKYLKLLSRNFWKLSY